MSAENRLIRVARAGLVGTLLAGFVDLPFWGDYTNFQPQITNASELEKPNFDVSEVSPKLPGIVADIESGDINKVARLLASSLTWNLYQDQIRGIDRNTALARFASSFKKGSPECIGYGMFGRNGSVPGLVMRGISTFPGVDTSIIMIEFNSVGGNLAFQIGGVQEISAGQLYGMRDRIKPCKTNILPPTPTPAPEPTARPLTPIEALGPDAIPNELKKAKIAFVARDNIGTNIYEANLDGTDKQNLTSDPRNKRELSPITNGNIVYSNTGISGDNNSKNEVVYLDIKSKKEKVIWSGTSSQGIPSCPSFGNNKIYWTLREINGQITGRNIWSANLDGSNIQRVTNDSANADEKCPLVFPNGQVTFNVGYEGGEASLPHGIVVYPDIKRVGQDYDPSNLKFVTTEGGAVSWISQDEIAYIGSTDLGLALFRIKTDGSQKKKIMDGVLGANLSQDGKWFLVTAASLNGIGGPVLDSHMYIVSSDGGKPIRLPDSIDGNYPIWQAKTQELRKIVSVTLGMDSEIVNGRDMSGLTDELFTALPRFGFKPGEFGLNSVTGGRFESGRLIPNDQACNDTYRGPQELGLSVATDLKKILDNDPNIYVIKIGHSYGGLTDAYAMEAIATGQVKTDASRIEFIFVDAPLGGVNKPFFDYLGAFTSRFNNNCLLFGVPDPNYINRPSGQAMLLLQDNRPQTKAHWREITERFKSQGGKVTTLGNIQDCVLAIEVCASDLELEARLLFNFLWRHTSVITQEMEGANNLWNALGILGYGHDRYFKDERGLKITLDRIGAQTDIQAVNSALQFVDSQGVNLGEISFKAPAGVLPQNT